MKKILNKWYLIIIGGFIVFAALVYGILGENSVISVHDNLDLFVPQYKMMKDTGTFWAHNASVPFLANISRDYLPSELNLYTMVFMILPEYAAYIVCYFIKIFIGLAGCILLAKASLKDDYDKYKTITYLVAFAFSILNLFPNFGIAFAAIPMLVFILNRIVTKPKFLWYLALFCYPFISYFSYLGIFFVGYLCLYFIYKWISSRKFPVHVFIAIPVLAVGYGVFEYRLFGQMLFSNIESIRSTMVQASLSWSEIFAMIWEGFATGDMHTESVHLYFVMPVCLLYFVLQTIGYIVKGKTNRIFKDYFNGVMLFIVFNSVFYGLYYWEPLRNLFEMLLPPLKGFEFHRLEFVNPFLWYVAFFIVLKRIYDYLPKFKWVADIFALVAIFIVVLSPTRYNDLYHTCLSQATRLINGTPNNELTYEEYYSVDLFEKAKKDIDYTGEWSVAYGFYPAVLEYNGIHTLDGYLGYYSQFYKTEFRKIIAPALERIPESKSYYDIWGARCYMYSGTYPSITNAYRHYEYTDEDLYIDINAFKEYCGRYIFSRVKLNNADEAGFELVGVYTDEKSPYTLYLYRTKSWFVEREHSDVAYEDRDADYDTESLDNDFARIRELIKDADERAKGLPENEKYSVLKQEELDEMDELYEDMCEHMMKMSTSYSILQIEFFKDVYDEETNLAREELFEIVNDYGDLYLQVLRDIANSPYEEFLKGKTYAIVVDELKEYEDMTEEEKERNIKIQSLQSEYEQAAGEEYYFEYKGKEYSEESFNMAEDLSYGDYIAIYKGIEAQKGAVLGEIYKELVVLHDEEAQDAGYENYAEYAYANVYPRDYKVDDIKKLCDEVRDKCGKYCSKASTRYAYVEDFDPGYVTQDDTAAFEQLIPIVYNMNPELAIPLEHLLKLNLYDMDPSPTKSERGFTLALSAYADAYIFDSPYESSFDIFTYTHEYGHYIEAYNNHENMLTAIDNMDTAEIQSQGLEVLVDPYYREIYGEEVGDFLEVDNIYNLMYSVYNACLYTEFEIYVYEHPDESVEEWAIEFGRLCEKYELGLDYDKTEPDYGWINVAHFFSQPCYYISYATSALAALDLYSVALEDEETAITKYMQIVTLSSEWLFREVLDYVGLPDVFEEGVPREIFASAYERIEELTEKYE